MPPQTQTDNEKVALENLRIKVRSKQNDFRNEYTPNEENSKYNIKEIVDTANKYFLIEILSPELKNNESKKREHKGQLINIVKCFLIFQFLFLFVLLCGTLIMIFVFHGVGNDLQLDYIEVIIKFISLYITSVVVELVAMLKYIVSNVFDTSITGLVEMYRDASNIENQKGQEKN